MRVTYRKKSYLNILKDTQMNKTLKVKNHIPVFVFSTVVISLNVQCSMKMIKSCTIINKPLNNFNDVIGARFILFHRREQIQFFWLNMINASHEANLQGTFPIIFELRDKIQQSKCGLVCAINNYVSILFWMLRRFLIFFCSF